MADVVLKASPRTVTGKQVKQLRREGRLPAVLYGKELEPINITLDAHSASLTLASVTPSQLVTIEIDGSRHTGLVRERQRHPVTGKLLHVDFLIISMTEKLRTSVLVAIEGEAPAIDNGYNVVTGVESLMVEALPRDLPDRITVDVSNLSEVGDAIYVRDIVLPPSVEVLTDPDEMMVLVTAPAAAVTEIEEEVAEEEEAEEPEVIERGKQEEGEEE